MSTVFFNYLKADFKKTKHLPIRAAHIFIPIGISAAFLIYYIFSSWNNKVIAYFQVLAMGFPFLIGLFCAMLAQQELSAGAFQYMLSVPERCLAFFSKLALLILFGMSAVILACIIFGTGEFFLKKNTTVDYSFYLIAAFVLIATNVFLYVLHLFLALRFNKGVTLIFGIIESLISALFITGLGDNIWIYVPAAWASRLVSFLLLKFNSNIMYNAVRNECICATVICLITTVLSLVAFGIWAYRWDGVKSNE